MIRQFGKVVEIGNAGPGAQQTVPPPGRGTSQPGAPKYCSTQQVSAAKQVLLPVTPGCGGQGCNCALTIHDEKMMMIIVKTKSGRG